MVPRARQARLPASTGLPGCRPFCPARPAGFPRCCCRCPQEMSTPGQSPRFAVGSFSQVAKVHWRSRKALTSCSFQVQHALCSSVISSIIEQKLPSAGSSACPRTLRNSKNHFQPFTSRSSRILTISPENRKSHITGSPHAPTFPKSENIQGHDINHK